MAIETLGWSTKSQHEVGVYKKPTRRLGNTLELLQRVIFEEGKTSGKAAVRHILPCNYTISNSYMRRSAEF